MQQLDNVLWAISIHALREEGDMPILRACLVRCLFLSTPSARRATGRFRLRRFLAEFLSTPSARRATQPRTPYAYERAISIHALCEEGDSGCCTSSSSPTDFYPRPLRGGRLAVSGRAGRPRSISIHALCEEGDRRTRRGAAMTGIFLSTPSARRATALSSLEVSGFSNFYPRPLRGGRLTNISVQAETKGISIHALCEEGDQRLFDGLSEPFDISIHALCEEGDFRHFDAHNAPADFYPRPLRGGRPGGFYHTSVPSGFLSTPSARRATVEPSAYVCCLPNFYPRPLRGGRPVRDFKVSAVVTYFYPRPLRGGRQQKQRQNLYFQTNYTTFCTNLEEL